MTAKVFAGPYSFPNNTQIDQYLRVHNNSGTAAISQSDDEEEGICAGRVETTDEVVTIEPLVPNCVYRGIADGAISANADIFRGDNGKISATDNGDRLGIAFDAAAADGDIIRFIYKGAEPPTAS